MTDEDARFEDGREAPLYLGALDVEDLSIVASLVRDSVFSMRDLSWRAKERRFALLLNRFRWEDRPGAAAERVQSVLNIDGVLNVASMGIDRRDKDLVMSLLTLSFEAGDDGAGAVVLTLAGDGGIRLDVEALDVTLRDVTRPYLAPSGRVPAHDP